MSKKTFAALILFSSFAVYAGQAGSAIPLPFYVYHGFKSPDNHYIPSGWMGDFGDLTIDDHCKLHPEDAGTCIKVAYSAAGSHDEGWAGIYWQYPVNNWGNKGNGYNLNGATKLVFKARGAKGKETIAEFKVGGIKGDYGDSGAAAIGPLTLTRDWQQYTIPLDGQELSSIAGGFCLSMSRQDNPDGAVVYLDDIRFE